MIGLTAGLRVGCGRARAGCSADARVKSDDILAQLDASELLSAASRVEASRNRAGQGRRLASAFRPVGLFAGRRKGCRRVRIEHA